MSEGIKIIQSGTMTASQSTTLPPQAQVSHGAYSRLPERIDFYPDNTISPGNFARWVSEELGVNIRKIGENNYPDGRLDVYYQQVYQGYLVEGSSFILHMENDQAQYANGLLFDAITVNTSLQIDTAKAKKLVKEEKGDVIIVKVEGPLILAQPDEDKNQFFFCYRLVYLQDVDLPYEAYLDISNDKFVKIAPLYTSFHEIGSGITPEGKRVSFGTQHMKQVETIVRPEGDLNIERAQGFRLYDSIKNIHTLSAKNQPWTGKSTLDSLSREGFPVLVEGDIVEVDNQWNNTPAAAEAHWGVSQSYDYFLERHQRRGIDGNNLYLRNIVNYRDNFKNAHYNPFVDALRFGDGANNLNPVTELDITAHEYTHGITYSLLKMNFYGEPGAINEGISDIFGTAVEFRTGKGDWIIAKRLKPGGIRNLKDPKRLADPDTYEGDFFEKKDSTRHQNSTVLSHWFYLLSEGGKDVNDNEDRYEIEPIGMEKATDLIYRSLGDLIPTLTFQQYRSITINLATRLYGKCAPETIQVTNAWYAVGLGDPFCDCFEGSLIYHTISEGEERSMKVYFKEDKVAIEAVSEKGTTIIRYTSDYDRYWHIKGEPDLDQYPGPMSGFFKNMVQGKHIFLRSDPVRFKTRKEYIEYRNRHRTGRSKKVSGYTAFEYNLEGYNFWSTEEVCLSMGDVFRTLAIISPSIIENNRKTFFGLPVEMHGKKKVWIDNIKEHPVSDFYFSG